MKRYGTKNWRYIASHLFGRLPKQCRERWCNQLDPRIKKEGLSKEEWDILYKAHEKHGNKWAEIAKQLPGRTANNIKNQWNTMLRRYIIKEKFESFSSEDSNLTKSFLNSPKGSNQFQQLNQNSKNSLVPNSEVELFTNFFKQNNHLPTFVPFTFPTIKQPIPCDDVFKNNLPVILNETNYSQSQVSFRKTSINHSFSSAFRPIISKIS